MFRHVSDVESPLLALRLARTFFCGQKAFLLLDFTSVRRIPSKFQ
jgi:hypothetical protein